MCIAVTINAQIEFPVYESVPVYPSTGYPAPAPVQTYPNTGYQVAPRRQQSQRQDNFQTVNAFYVNDRGAFQKIRIKVNVVSGAFSREQVYVRGYRDLTYNSWHSMNSQATAVTQHSSDPDVIKENFDWKCYILNVGTVYF